MTESPRVGVVGGSRSDFPVLQAAVDVLGELGVPAELRVVSAHRTPDHLFRYAESAAERGIPVATVAIGNGLNAGLLAAAILALTDEALATRLADWRARQTAGVLDDSASAADLTGGAVSG